MSNPIILDFEASSLRGYSHPIEVAWGDVIGECASFLIKPLPEWDDWDEGAEYVHGITQEQLQKEGASPVEVCMRLREALEGKVVYTDADFFYQRWLDKLFTDTEGGDSPVTFLDYSKLPAIQSLYREGKFDIVKAEVKEQIATDHRAAADVDALLMVYERALRGEY